MSTHVLHFTIGPVQGFIGQAQRTRDLWAGSFLLSCLAGMAMRAVEDAGNRVLFPRIADDPLYAVLRWDETAPARCGHGPVIGSLPNRFKAEVDASFDPALAARRVRDYWRHIADVVREQILQNRLDAGQRAVWDRQVAGFFEITWVMGEPARSGEDGAWLDRRKNWRSQAHATEPGDHCMLIGELQELSEYVRGRGERDAQLAFWADIAGAIEAYLARRPRDDLRFVTLELGPTERLSAIALIKRLFPVLNDEHLEEALGFVPGGAERRDVRCWPSLAGIAAAPWLAAAHRAAPAAAFEFVGGIKRAEEIGDGKYASTLSRAERSSPIPRIRKLDGFGDLDGKLVFDFAVEAAIADTDRGWLAENRIDQAAWERRVYTAAKTGVPRLLRQAGQIDERLAGGPKPFLALLQMDGDRVGDLLGAEGPGADKVSAALARYTKRVRSIVRDREGVVIYAGGDDVLALFSIDTVLAATLELHAAYGKAFEEAAPDWPGQATTSAGIAFAHFGVPFTRITEESRRLLEEVAKEQNGRDSLAVSVTKQSGRQIAWCTTFNRMRSSPREPFGALVESFGRRVGEAERFAGFVYNMRERYQAYLTPDDDGAALTVPIEQLMLAEWLKGENTDRAGFELAKDEVRLRQLEAVCQTWRNEDGRQKMNPFRMDGALLVKFLDDNLILEQGAPADG